MSLDLHIQPGSGKNDEGQMEQWVSVLSRDMKTREHCIPCTAETQDLTFVRLNTLVLEAYQAGQINGREEWRAALRELIGAKKQ